MFDYILGYLKFIFLYIQYHPPLRDTLLVLLILFSVFFLFRLLIRGKIKGWLPDLKQLIRSWIGWLVTPLLKLNFALLDTVPWMIGYRTGKTGTCCQVPIPWEAGGLIFAGNHPCPKLQDIYKDVVDIYFLLPKNYFNPVAFLPYQYADEMNFFRPWLFKWLRLYSISVYRNSEQKMPAGLSLRPAIELLKRRVNLIVYPEGGRTNSSSDIITSPLGNKLRRELKPGAAYLSIKTGCPIIPFYKRIEGDDSPSKPVTPQLLIQGFLELNFYPKVKLFTDFGEALWPRERETVEELTQRLQEALLKTADKQTERLKAYKSALEIIFDRFKKGKR